MPIPDHSSVTSDSNLIAAYAAALEVASVLDLPVVLQRIVNLAREVVPAKYAALGVADDKGRIQQFITSGITVAQRAAIGDLPQGRGLLGALIRDREPILVADMSQDPRSFGFPPNHPPMHSLLGVPITIGTRVLGNLYLTERLDGTPFTESDRKTLQVLAAHAATTIDRAQLYAAADRSRREAEEQRDQLNTILNSLPSAVLLLRAPDGNVEMANAAALSMLDRQASSANRDRLPQPGVDYQLRNVDGTELQHDHWPGVRALRGDMVRNKQLTFTFGSNRQLPVLIQAAPLRDATGAITRAVVVFQDITHIREAEQLKDDFLSLVSHELRTPLTSIHGGAHLLVNQRDDLAPEVQSEILHDIVVESERLDRTLRNMLTLTSIRAGRLEPETEPILIGPLASRLISESRLAYSNRAFNCDIPDQCPAAEGDPELLDHVLRNLIENAVKYSPSGGTVNITATSERDVVHIHVKDNGFGIANEHLPTIFERFRRPGAAPTVRGMGLGLYLSRHLVEAQGGQIAVHSDGPNLGSTFTVTLPVATGWAEA